MSTIEEIMDVMREFCLFAMCDKQAQKNRLEKTDVGCDLAGHLVKIQMLVRVRYN